MDPVTIGLAGAQTAVGIAQRNEAKRRRKRALESFSYDIPSATEEQVRLAREQASRTGLPGEDVTRARMESGMAGAIEKGERGASTAEDVLGLYSNMYGQQTDFNQKLLEAGAKYKSEQEANLAKSLGLMAQAEEQQFYYNKYIPYLSEMGYASDQAQGGAANIASGLQSAYSNWENEWMMDAWKDIYGGNTPPSTTSMAGNSGGLSYGDNRPYFEQLWSGTVPDKNIGAEVTPYGPNFPAY